MRNSASSGSSTPNNSDRSGYEMVKSGPTTTVDRKVPGELFSSEPNDFSDKNVFGISKTVQAEKLGNGNAPGTLRSPQSCETTDKDVQVGLKTVKSDKITDEKVPNDLKTPQLSETTDKDVQVDLKTVKSDKITDEKISNDLKTPQLSETTDKDVQVGLKTVKSDKITDEKISNDLKTPQLSETTDNDVSSTRKTENIENKDLIDKVMATRSPEAKKTVDSDLTTQKRSFGRKRKADHSQSIISTPQRKRKVDTLLRIEEYQKHYYEGVVGEVLVFGQGDVGQLGLGEEVTEKKKPFPLSKVDKVIQIACGGMHSAALTQNKKLLSWGCNDDHALGRNTAKSETPENEPFEIKLPAGYKPVKVTAGDSHTAVLTECGNVFACGIFRNSEKKIGLIKENTHEKEMKIIYHPNIRSYPPAVDICSGNDHILILDCKGNVYSCGSPEQGQLGRVTERSSKLDTVRSGYEVYFQPKKIMFFSFSTLRKHGKIPIVTIGCGSFHSFAIDAEGNVFSWGLNSYSQICIPQPDKELDCAFSDSSFFINEALTNFQGEFIAYLPLNIATFKIPNFHNDAVEITGGQHHTLILDKVNSKLYSVGRSDYGRLGIGKIVEPFYMSPQVVDLQNLKNEKPVHITCGEVTSYLITDKNRLFSWGMGSCLQLGQNDEEDVLLPTLVVGKNLDYEKEKVTSVQAGGQHVVLIKKKL